MAKTTATCIICGNIHPTANLIKVANPKTHYSYICPTCAQNTEGYNSNEANQTNTTGKKEKNFSITIGTELETSANMNQDRLKVLESYGWVATDDCSISGPEYKSPVFHNLNGVAKLLYSVLESPETGAGLPDAECGTHVNVWSEHLNVNDFDHIRHYYRTIFRPLFDAICRDGSHNELFGRRMNGWCDEFSPMAHCALINMESCKRSHPRIEFRICKYVENRQFMNCLKFASECMKTIAVNFCFHYSETDVEHNHHKAQVTAKKLVKVYNKYRGL